MTRATLVRLTGVVPIAMSLSALSLVLVAVTTGWERSLADEGIAAHLFQLLIAFQLPFIVACLAIAARHPFAGAIRTVAFQITAIALALASLAFFRL